MSDNNKKDNELSLEQLMRKREIDATAWRMLNIFRQFHVIEGGIAEVNKYFITADENVIESIAQMPSGKKLAEHIRNLQSKKTNINSISEYLLPFGEDVLLDFQENNKDIYDKEIETKKEDPMKTDADIKEAFADYKKTELKDIPDLTESHTEEKSDTTDSNIPQFNPIDTETQNIKINDIDSVINVIMGFTASPDKLNEFKELRIISDIGQNWEDTIKEAITTSDYQNKENILTKFHELVMYDKAVTAWHEAQSIISNPNNVNKEQLKNRLQYFRDYLLMFGDAGDKVLKNINDILNR